MFQLPHAARQQFGQAEMGRRGPPQDLNEKGRPQERRFKRCGFEWGESVQDQPDRREAPIRKAVQNHNAERINRQHRLRQPP